MRIPKHRELEKIAARFVKGYCLVHSSTNTHYHNKRCIQVPARTLVYANCFV